MLMYKSYAILYNSQKWTRQSAYFKVHISSISNLQYAPRQLNTLVGKNLEIPKVNQFKLREVSKAQEVSLQKYGIPTWSNQASEKPSSLKLALKKLIKNLVWYKIQM